MNFDLYNLPNDFGIFRQDSIEVSRKRYCIIIQLRNKAFFPGLHKLKKTEANVRENLRADQ